VKVKILSGLTAVLVGTATALVWQPQMAYAAQAKAAFTQEQLNNPISAHYVHQMLTTGNASKLATRAGANADTCSSYPVYYSSHGNHGAFVSVEIGYTGSRQYMLRARGDYRGPWEQFEECWYVNTSGRYVYTIRSLANWMYVTTEYNYSNSLARMLRARSSNVDIWQRFYIEVPANWQMTIESVQHGYYVAVEMDYGGQDFAMLRARTRGTIGTWELFSSS
jgi:hypothetical protein